MIARSPNQIGNQKHAAFQTVHIPMPDPVPLHDYKEEPGHKKAVCATNSSRKVKGRDQNYGRGSLCLTSTFSSRPSIGI